MADTNQRPGHDANPDHHYVVQRPRPNYAWRRKRELRPGETFGDGRFEAVDNLPNVLIRGVGINRRSTPTPQPEVPVPTIMRDVGISGSIGKPLESTTSKTQPTRPRSHSGWQKQVEEKHLQQALIGVEAAIARQKQADDDPVNAAKNAKEAKFNRTTDGMSRQ